MKHDEGVFRQPRLERLEVVADPLVGMVAVDEQQVYPPAPLPGRVS